MSDLQRSEAISSSLAAKPVTWGLPLPSWMMEVRSLGSCAQCHLVEQLVVMASHVTHCTADTNSMAGCAADELDLRGLARYANELRGQPQWAIWLQLYREGGTERHTPVRVRNINISAVDGISLWGERAAWERFPRLAAAVNVHPHMREQPRYIQFYYYFHVALALWFDAFGSRYPRVRHVWRLESDAFFAGSLAELCALTENVDADVLLPSTYHRNRSHMTREYAHWPHQTFLSSVPASAHVFALVCVGRYSRKFITELMTLKWAEGVVGFEEILIPTACLNATSCTLVQFDGRESVAAHHVKFRVLEPSPLTGAPGPRAWECGEFLQARGRLSSTRTLDLWHPVKDRTCVLSALEQEDFAALGSAADLRRRSVALAEQREAESAKSGGRGFRSRPQAVPHGHSGGVATVHRGAEQSR